MAEKTTLDTLDTALKNHHATTSPTATEATTEAEAQFPPLPADTTTTKRKAPVPASPAPAPVSKAADKSSKAATRKLSQHDTDDKKEQLERLQQDLRKLVLWENPVRSGAYFALLMAGLILSKSYSVIQIVSALLTISIAINLVYVNVTIQTQRILADRPGVNPFHALLQDGEITTIDRGFLKRSAEMVADVTEAFFQWVSRIVLIDNNAHSIKWLGIFYIVWKLSAIISVRTLVTLITLLLFSVPLLYTYNKTFVDARIQQARSVCQTQLEQGQVHLEQGWSQFCSHFKLAPSSDLPPKPSGSRKVD